MILEDQSVVPYSQAPLHRLRRRAAGGKPRIRFDHPASDGVNEFYSFEFRKMYAALLLRERGL